MSKFSTEEKVRIVLDGMRYPEGVTGLCRQVGISRSTYCHWQRTLLEKGKEGLIVRGNGKEEARQRISVAIKRYSTWRHHQGIGDIKRAFSNKHFKFFFSPGGNFALPRP